MNTTQTEWRPVRLPPHLANAVGAAEPPPADTPPLNAAIEADPPALHASPSDAEPPPDVTQDPVPAVEVEPTAEVTTAPVSRPSTVHSHAFDWQDHQFAFGAKWLAFHRPSRRATREAIHDAGATHWLNLRADNGAQLALYDLPGESGKLYSAAEAARDRFGRDFIGVFSFRSDTYPTGYWIIALSEDVVVCDAVFPDIDSAQAAYSNLVADRSFATNCAPDGFVDGANTDIVLADFLEPVGKPLQTPGLRLRTIAATALVTLLAGGIAGAGFGIPQELAPPPSSIAPQTAVASHEPTFPTIVPPRDFALSCEAAVAGAMFGPAGGWRFASATCVPGSITLQFHGDASAQSMELEQIYANATADPVVGTATATLPLTAPTVETRELLTGREAQHRFSQQLSIVDPQYQFWTERSATSEQPYDTLQFTINTGLTVPVLLDSFRALPGSEFNTVNFDASTLRWRVEGRFHAYAH